MPYAYIHYPFENVELFEKNFPGHFVAEGLDQTRGWFYTLMVLSTALFGKPAFRNLICNGLVLAEDGRKMSKRLKNYPSPVDVINDHGADALRLYIINSPVVLSLYVLKRMEFLVLFLVQNAKRLEVEGLAPFILVDKVTLQQSSNVLDQWINSATLSLVHFLQQEMDGYHLYTFVLEELNVKSVVPCNDLLKYASLQAKPDFSLLGKRLGKSMGIVAKEVKAMSQKDILDFEKHGEVTIATHCLKLSDIKINRGFRRPDNMTEEEIDAAGDGDVLVILDLRPDESLFEAGVAREVVNRIQKLRKKAALEPTDMVELYFKSLDEDESTSQQILNSQEQYIRDVLGSYLLPSTMMPPHAVILAQESFHGISNLAFSITLARPALLFNSNAVLALYREDTKFANGLQTYLLSRDHHNLKSEFHLGNGKILSVLRWQCL